MIESKQLKPMRSSSLALLVVFILASCSYSNESYEQEHPTADNMLPAASVNSFIALTPDSLLIDSLSVGSMDVIGDEREIMLGKILGAAIVDSTSIAILDNSPHRLKIYNRILKKLSGTLARKGRGPGEILQPTDFDVTGNTIIVADKVLKVALFKIAKDTIRPHDELILDFTPNKVCTIDDILFVSGIRVGATQTIYRYSLKTLAYLGKFHDAYKSDNPVVRTLLSNNLISCNQSTKQILVTSPYLPYIYAYDIDGNQKWVSEIPDFNPMKAVEKLSRDGRPSLSQSFNADGISDRYSSFEEQRGTDYNYLQVSRSIMKNHKKVKGYYLTYKIDSKTGEGQLVSKSIPRIFFAKDNVILHPDNFDYPRIRIVNNPFSRF